jgi:tripartite-type tricarboxylate transporter receptor subunit TctC
VRTPRACKGLAYFAGAGAAPVAGTPEQFSAYLDAEIKKWADVFKGAEGSVDF